MTDLFPAATSPHTTLHGRRVNPTITRGTGLHVADEINGRPATDDEIAAKTRAYEHMRQRDLELIKVAAPTPVELDLVYAIGPLPWEKDES
jgi:hypothetical protein